MGRHRVKDKAQECGSVVLQLTSSLPAVSCATDGRSYLQAEILLTSGHTNAQSNGTKHKRFASVLGQWGS